MWLACIGKLKAGPEKAIAEDYLARIQQIARTAGVKPLAVKEAAESQKATAPLRMTEEAAFLWAQVPEGSAVICLDERGKALGSEAFAALLRKHADQGQGIVFLLGGPDGHAAETRARASHVIALGAMTWPHRLARIMVLEQIYRGLTILTNHPYHRA
jgi:23S rRNA (pseudouridine1915-N3)-methyltransferase